MIVVVLQFTDNVRLINTYKIQTSKNLKKMSQRSQNPPVQQAQNPPVQNPTVQNSPVQNSPVQNPNGISYPPPMTPSLKEVATCSSLQDRSCTIV